MSINSGLGKARAASDLLKLGKELKNKVELTSRASDSGSGKNKYADSCREIENFCMG